MLLQAGEMPLWYYLPLHPEARLSAQEQAVLRIWAGGAGHGVHEEHEEHEEDD